MNQNEKLKLDRKSLGFSENRAAEVLGKMSQKSWHKLERGIDGCVIHDDIIEDIEYIKDWVKFVFNKAFTESKFEKIVILVFEDNETQIEFLKYQLGDEFDSELFINPYNQYVNMCNLLIDNAEYIIIKNKEDLKAFLN